MKKTIYFVNFEDTELIGKGTVRERGYEGWHEMHQVSGFDVLEDFYNSVSNIFNQHFHRPNKPGDIQMTSYQTNAIKALLKANLTNNVIKKITIHRMHETDEGLFPDKEVVLENASVVQIKNDTENYQTEICLSGFAKEEMIEFPTQAIAPTKPLHFEYDAAREISRIV